MIPRLHLVTDDRILADASFPRAMASAISAGSDRIALHLRGPRTPVRALHALGGVVGAEARRRGTRLLVNDRVDLALALGADGAHLGRRSLPIAEARKVLGAKAILGCSLHGPDEARDVGAADFVFAGSIFRTESHPSRTPAGTDLVRKVRALLPSVPVLGIGGIDAERVEDVVSAGAHGVAVVRAVWSAADPGRAVGALLEAIEAAHGAGGGVDGIE